MKNTIIQLRQSNARLHTLIEIGLELASERNNARLLQKVCEATRELFHATYVTLGILDLDDRTVKRVVSSGATEQAGIAQGDSLTGFLQTVVTERRAVRGHNADGDPVKLSLPPAHPPVQSFLAAPIASPGQVYGWICFVDNDGQPFSEDDEHMVTALSGQVGRIYENGHFHALAETRLVALEQERDRAQDYLDIAEVMLIALDTEGRIQMVNRFACGVLGWTARELLGRDWFDTCLPAGQRAEWKQQKFAELLDGRVPFGENAVITRAGEERQIEWRNTVIRDEAGRVTGTLSSGADITERQALEAQFQHSQKMEAIGQLAGGVAHDFNNLLTVILGFSTLVLDDLPAGDRHRADLEEIHQAGKRASALTRQLLTFSRKQITEPTILDINVVVDEMREMLGRLLGADVEIVLVHGAAPDWVLCDHGQMEQVIMNLAVNARDSMHTGGTLTIETSTVALAGDRITRVGHLPKGTYVKLMVTDTGTGITPAVLAHLFEPFFTTKGLGKGTGLGLATVHGIAGRCGGGIDVDTSIGRGTTFTVYFPQALPGADARLRSVPAKAPRACTQLLLVVDDDQGVRDLARRLLERAGYRVLAAADANEARALFKANPAVDLVLTDVIMPGDSGPDLVRSLSDDRPDLKVVYMSGYDEDAIAHRGVLDPGIVFLHKPFTAETLNNKVGGALDGASRIAS